MTKATRHIVAVTFIALGLTGCATTYHLRPETRTPAASGTIKTRADDNNNTAVTVRVKHLPAPSTLDPTLRAFVVWIRPTPQAEFRNAGQIVLGTDRDGELNTKTPHRNFELMITAEASGTPAQPGQHVILRGFAGRN